MKKLNTTSILPMNCWAAEDIPSVKASTLGYRSITTSELLSIVIGSGTSNENATDLSRRLLADNENSLRKISKMSVNDLIAYDGIGENKASKILAALELAHRMNMERAEERPDLSRATLIYNYMHPRIGMLDEEEFWALFLNQNFRMIQAKRISHGGISETLVDVRIIAREAVLCNATMVVAVHNHPSGKLSPSRDDDGITQTIKNMCEVMRFHFVDHVIVTDGAYYSYHEQGKI